MGAAFCHCWGKGNARQVSELWAASGEKRWQAWEQARRDIRDEVTENVKELCPSAASSKASHAVSRQRLKLGSASRQRRQDFAPPESAAGDMLSIRSIHPHRFALRDRITHLDKGVSGTSPFLRLTLLTPRLIRGRGGAQLGSCNADPVSSLRALSAPL